MNIGQKITRKFIYKFINNLMQSSIAEIEDGRETSPILAQLCRQAGAEGCVLLKNNDVLPLINEKVAVFGRCQSNYFYVGYGSGGDVKAPYKVSLLEGLKNSGLEINRKVMEVYETWIKKYPPYDGFWGFWPMNYEEMPLTENMVLEAAQESDTAIVVIGRSAGEDRENKLKKGSWYLTDAEEDMLFKVSSYFKKVCVVLNCGSIMDMSWVEKYKIEAVLYAWQGGQESGNAVADVLTGKVSPCGKLTDTIAVIEDYPSTKDFGAKKFNNYTEDIYVGYRYFETFAKDKVIYPFGFGLSYTTFAMEAEEVKVVDENHGTIKVKVKIKNTGNHAGREVVQLYYGAPQGKLGKADRSLVAYKKTKLLQRGEEEILVLKFLISDMSSFDDTGITGAKDAFVLEPGEYSLYLGSDVRSAKKIGSYDEKKLKIVSQLKEVCSVQKPFKRLINNNGRERYELIAKGTRDLKQRISQSIPKGIDQTDDKGYKLIDVKNGRITMEQFIAQLSDVELEAIVRGADEGMYSPQGVAGNAGVFGGTIQSLREKGIPIVNTNDGPSGIRLQAHSTLLPIGIALASTFDDELIENIMEQIGREMIERGSNVLLAPGMNIHRNPLCGRNFEYFSEDPVLTGNIATAYIKGVQSVGISAVPKHFACNNQETKRLINDSRVSGRALREIYLKAFEICIKKASPDFIMTSYNKINGVWSYYNYDLATEVLRNEWGFKGCVMTDWWIRNDKSPDFNDVTMQAYRVQAQVDIFMPGSANRGRYKGKCDGTLIKSLQSKEGITRGEVQRCAKNVLRYCVNHIL